MCPLRSHIVASKIRAIVVKINLHSAGSKEQPVSISNLCASPDEIGQYSTANSAVEKAVWIPFTSFPLLEGQKIDSNKSIVVRDVWPHIGL